MEAAGRARRASSYAFPLIGVAPAREIPPRGKTPVDPNHSHVIAVDNPSAPAKRQLGIRDRNDVLALCGVARRTPVRHDSRRRRRYYADGGGIERPRGAPHHSDRGHRPRGRCSRIVVAEDAGLGAELVSLKESAEKARLTRRPELFTVVSLQGGASGLRHPISSAIGSAR